MPSVQDDQDPDGTSHAGRAPRRHWALGLALAVLLSSGLFWVTVGADADGLATYRELSLGTDPFRADTDGDGLSDGWEHDRQMDPLALDTDDDEVDDGDEVDLGTDPLAADTDQDGLNDSEELPLGTDPTRSDTDADGADDLLETTHDSDPLDVDSDDDGLADGEEYRIGADPQATDTDDDGLPDDVEAALIDTDCDRDGAHAAADPDDDADLLLDGVEEDLWRCDPDADDDTVLDGQEGARECITLSDCDADALPDDVEHADPDFDALRADTFRVGLLDSVSYAFRERGQPPSSDDDNDGIPDAWEDEQGLIDWGVFTPQRGRPDLLVEYIRVQGPQSQKAASLDFTPAYEQVARAFETQSGIEMQWTETRVQRSWEGRPPIIPSYDHSYYEDILSRSRHGDNPYVLTVAMNPQHDQSQVQHAGVAPIRGMLAAVDYGFFTYLTFAANNQTVEFRAYWESLIAAGTEQGQYGLRLENAGATADGEYYVRGTGSTAYWTPLWYQTAPRFEFDSGEVVQTTFHSIRVDTRALAGVIMHEIGHTLGLCHLETFTCLQGITLASGEQITQSSMHSPSALSRTAFLTGEWDNVRTYIGCPPQDPIVVLADGGSRTQVLERKYTVAEADILNVDTRRCGETRDIERTITPREDLHPWTHPAGTVGAERLAGEPTTYVAPRSMAAPAETPDAVAGHVLFLLATVVLTVLAAQVPRFWPDAGPWSRRQH